MSEKEESIDSNNNNEKIKVYDNDDAYLFGDASLEESNEEEDKNENYNNLNENENNINSPQSSSHKKIKNEEEYFPENEKNNIVYDNYDTKNEDKDSQKIDDNNNQNNNENYYLDNQIDENNNYNSQEINSREDPLINEKFVINDITTDMENEQDYEEKESNNNNISNKSKENKIKNNDEKQQKEVENNTTNENENDSNDSEVPLITLNFLSICQCCKNQFNSKKNIPYLFKCGHFFCKQCIEEQFTDEEGIKCPNDGIIGKYLSELKILNNFITDKPPSQRTKPNKKYCEYHKGQNLTHYIEDTKELICVYCAFERYKSNPGIEIKDINEKCKSMETKIDSIIDDNQHNIEIIQNSLREIKNNKENEEKKINDVFNGLFEILKLKRDELLAKIDKIFTDNAQKLSEKLEIFSDKLEKSEKLKTKILFFDNNNSNNNQEEINFSQLIYTYDSFIKEISNIYKISLQKYKFINNEEMKIKGLLSTFGTLELKEKNINFFDNNLQIKTKEEDIINSTNDSSSKKPIKVNKEIDKNNSYKIDNFYHFINNKEVVNESSSLSNKRNKKDENNKKNIKININSAINNNSKNKYIDRNNKNFLTNPNKSSGDIKINNNNRDKKKESKNKLTKKNLNNKNGILSDGTTFSTYGNSISKINNHSLGGINTSKISTQKFKYNFSLGQNYSLNNISCINSLNNQKMNSMKNNSKNKNVKMKNNKSITAPGRTVFKVDNKNKNK